jgi:hypothetical protein
MRLDALKHMAEVVRAMARPQRIVVIGSSSLFASFPAIDMDTGPLANTNDADFVVLPFDEQTGTMLHDSLGADEEFHQRHGYYADILRPLALEELTPGWEARLVPLPGMEDLVFCLDPRDMAVCKLRAGRPKDVALLAVLVREGMLDAGELREHLFLTPMREAMIVRAHECLRQVREQAGLPPGAA